MAEPEPLGTRFRSLRDQVVEELRDGIIEGTLQGGQRLVERDLSDQLLVSRVTIREALQALAADGLVTLLPRRGAMVTIVGESDLRDMGEVRASLERLAAGKAAERRDDAGLARLRASLEEAQAAVEAKDDRAAARANVRFHEEMVSCADNELLSDISASLHGRLLRVFRMTRHLDTDGARDHDALLQAIEAQDVEGAKELAYRHVLSTWQATVEAIHAGR